MNQEKSDSELFARLATLMADERRHLLQLLEKGTILDCSRPEVTLDTTRLDHLQNAIEACPHTNLTYDEGSPNHPWSLETVGCDTVYFVGKTLREILDQSIEFDASGEYFDTWQAMKEENAEPSYRDGEKE